MNMNGTKVTSGLYIYQIVAKENIRQDSDGDGQYGGYNKAGVSVSGGAYNSRGEYEYPSGREVETVGKFALILGP